MKAATIDRFSTPAQVHDVSEPALEDNAVLVRVTAAGVNPVDWKLRDGQAGKRPFPLTLGQDFAGVVERVGRGITRVSAGDRIFGIARDHGAYAEVTEIRDEVQHSPFTRIPAGVSDAQAAALPTPALTAFAALEAIDAGTATELLLVGAAGAVGSAALQLGRERNVKITAIVRTGQETAARDAGAKTVIAHDANDGLIEAIRAAHPGSFNAILDLVSDGETLKQNAEVLERGGTLVTTIHDADEAWFRERGIRAINIVMAETPQSSPAGLDTLAGMVADGRLTVNVASERPLDDANAVLDGIKSGGIHGKVILRP